MKGFLFTVVLLLGISQTDLYSQSKLNWVEPRPGVWSVTGSDEEGLKWTAAMHIARTGFRDGMARYRGYFAWRSVDGATSGKEFFVGSFDKRTGRLSLKGYRAKNAKGELGVGNYTALLRQKGQRISRGRWSGQDTVPGTWSARWARY